MVGRREDLTLSSPMPATEAAWAVYNELSARSWRDTWNPAVLGSLEVGGTVTGDWLQLHTFRRGERAPLLRPRAVGRITPTVSGCTFCGYVETSAPGLPVLIVFLCIVGLAFIVGVGEEIASLVHARGARQIEHWLPLVIAPAVLLGFALLIVAVSGSTARRQRAFLIQWLADTLTQAGSGTTGPR